MSESEQRIRSSLTTAWIATAVQVLAGIAITFGDIGFDRPGSFGLSFGHFLFLAVVALISFIVGLANAARARSSIAVASVILGAVFCVAGTIISG